MYCYVIAIKLAIMAAMNHEIWNLESDRRGVFLEQGKPAWIFGLGISSTYHTLYFDDQGFRFWLSVDCVALVCYDGVA